MATLLPALVSLGCARVVGVCDYAEDRLLRAAREYNIEAADADFSALCHRLRPDVVVMAGPPQLHATAAETALQLGAHVLVEKPPALTTRQLHSMATVAERCHRIGMVAHNLRYTAAWARVSEILEATSVSSISIQYYASGPRGTRWGEAPLTAFLLTHAIHAFDLALSAIGKADNVSHHLQPAIGGVFTLSSHLETKRGQSAQVVVSTAAPRFLLHVHIVTVDNQVIEVTSPSELVVHRAQESRDAQLPGGREYWRTRHLDAGYETAGYGTELRKFFDSVAGRTEPCPTFREELDVYRIIDEVYTSRSNRSSNQRGSAAVGQ